MVGVPAESTLTHPTNPDAITLQIVFTVIALKIYCGIPLKLKIDVLVPQHAETLNPLFKVGVGVLVGVGLGEQKPWAIGLLQGPEHGPITLDKSKLVFVNVLPGNLTQHISYPPACILHVVPNGIL